MEGGIGHGGGMGGVLNLHVSPLQGAGAGLGGIACPHVQTGGGHAPYPEQGGLG